MPKSLASHLGFAEDFISTESPSPLVESPSQSPQSARPSAGSYRLSEPISDWPVASPTESPSPIVESPSQSPQSARPSAGSRRSPSSLYNPFEDPSPARRQIRSRSRELAVDNDAPPSPTETLSDDDELLYENKSAPSSRARMELPRAKLSRTYKGIRVGPIPIPKTLRDNFEVVRSAVGRDGRVLRYASKRLRDDREIVSVAVKSNGEALRYASKKLRDDGEIVHAAIEQWGPSLKFASTRLRKDASVIPDNLTNVFRTLRHFIQSPSRTRSRSRGLSFEANG